MKVRSVCIAVAAAVVTLFAGPFAAGATTPTEYYLALGDSLSRGYQPGFGDTDRGYPDVLSATLQASSPSLQLVKLGCSGESTTSMINGGICSYPDGGSQLDAAAAFLRAHSRQVRYVTIDIGANDVDGCAPSGTLDEACIQQGLSTIARNLPVILARLRLSGGFGATWAGMTYYDPFLAAWLTGPDGQATAHESVQVTNVLNALERFNYSIFGFRVADVSAAFHTQDFTTQVTLPGFGQVPLNVATICELTFMCTLQNIHPTDDGYRLIAQTFAEVLDRRTG